MHAAHNNLEDLHRIPRARHGRVIEILVLALQESTGLNSYKKRGKTELLDTMLQTVRKIGLNLLNTSLAIHKQSALRFVETKTLRNCFIGLFQKSDRGVMRASFQRQWGLNNGGHEIWARSQRAGMAEDIVRRVVNATLWLMPEVLIRGRQSRQVIMPVENNENNSI